MNKFMEEASKLAAQNIYTNDGGPFGACVVKDNKIIGRGSNQVLKRQDPTLHAEIVAIRDACQNINSYDLSGCELYTTSYPCPMCMGAIMWANIKKVYYGNTKEDTAKIGFRDDFIYTFLDKVLNGEENNSILSLKCIDREETLKEYAKYLAKDDKTIY